MLELDPDLGADLTEAEFERARAVCRTSLVSVGAGRLDLSIAGDGQPAPVGLLIIDGMVCREVKLRDHCVIELLGPGDVLRPPPREPGPAQVVGPTTTVVREVLAAELGRAFIRCVGNWPELLDRIEEQHQRLVAQELALHLRRADQRLLVTLWLLANRWGYVTPEGIQLRLSLTHSVLGRLIAAQRSTATLALRTLALRTLEQNHMIRRTPSGPLVLTEQAEGAVRRITRTTAGSPLGDTLRLLQRAAELQENSKALRADARQIAASQRRSHRGDRGEARTVT